MCVVRSENRQIDNPDRVVVGDRFSEISGRLNRRGLVYTIWPLEEREYGDFSTITLRNASPGRTVKGKIPDSDRYVRGRSHIVSSIYILREFDSLEPLSSEIAAHRLCTTEEYTKSGGIRVTTSVSGITAETMLDNSAIFVLDVMAKMFCFFLNTRILLVFDGERNSFSRRTRSREFGTKIRLS